MSRRPVPWPRSCNGPARHPGRMLQRKHLARHGGHADAHHQPDGEGPCEPSAPKLVEQGAEHGPGALAQRCPRRRLGRGGRPRDSAREGRQSIPQLERARAGRPRRRDRRHAGRGLRAPLVSGARTTRVPATGGPCVLVPAVALLLVAPSAVAHRRDRVGEPGDPPAPPAWAAGEAPYSGIARSAGIRAAPVRRPAGVHGSPTGCRSRKDAAAKTATMVRMNKPTRALFDDPC